MMLVKQVQRFQWSLRVDDDGTLNYTIPVTPTPGTIIVNDDDSLPKIKIATDYEFISPGLPLTFTVSIEPKNQTPVTVPITARDETNAILDFLPSTLIVGTSGSVSAKVATFPTSTGNVTITLGNLAGYIPDPPLVVPIETPSNPASLTISGPSGPVAEGDMATFTISANPTINKNIIIEVDVFDHVAKGTDFVDNGNHYIPLMAGESSATLNVPTKSNSSTATDGVLVATLLDGPGYTHSSPTNIAYAEVRDKENTAPVLLTVSAENTLVYQEDNIVFTISRTGDTTNALAFKYDLTDVEDVIIGEGLAITGTIDANKSSTQITLPSKSAITTYTSAAGVTLRLLSVLEAPELQYRLGSLTELKVAVNSATKPVITLSIEPNYVERGETFNLVATATPAPIRTTSVIVDLTSEPQTYPINNRYLLEAFRGEQTIEIAANATRGQLAITSTPVDLNPSDGDIENSDAIINATLQADSNYSIPSETADRTERVGVLGTLPELSISTRNLYVKEDAGNIQVTIYTSFLPFVGLPLKVTSLTATEVGTNNYLGTVDFSNLEIRHQDEIFIHDRFRGIRTSVPINSYPDYRGPGEISLTLADTDYYTANAEASTLNVNIQDVQPYSDRTISIDAPERVLEGEDIVITLTNDAPLGTNEMIDVGFAVASIPVEYYNESDSTSSPVQFTSTSLNNTEIVTIKTADVADLATNGTIYLRVLPGLNYEPPQPDQIEVQIIAHETLQTISIAADATTIDEGEDAVFTVSATGTTLTEELPVSITVEHQNGGNFIPSSTVLPNEVKVKTTGTGEVRIATEADADDETDGTIKVTLDESTELKYLLGTKTTETITIKDNDDDGTLPQLSISSESPISVGGDVVFKLATNKVPAGNEMINVRVRISETGDFLETPARESPRVATVSVGNSGGELKLSTKANVNIGVNAKVVARVISEDSSSGTTATYTIGADPVAEVYFAPILSVGNGTKAVERDGAMAIFPVNANYNSGKITVYYTPTQSGNFLASNVTAGMIASAELDFKGGTSATLAIPITNDEISEPNGSIMLTLMNDKNTVNGALFATYIVAQSPGNQGTVIVIDDETLPRISIVTTSGGAAENDGPAQFILTTTELSSTTTLIINATPAEDGHEYLSDEVANIPEDFSVEFSDSDGDGTFTGLLSVALDNDTTGEPTGNIKLTLNTDPKLEKSYQLGSTIEGNIFIWDDDAPELSISASKPEVTEGEKVFANFVVSAKASANSMVTVRYGLSEGISIMKNFIDDDGSIKMANLDFTNGIKTAILPIMIANDNLSEPDGIVTIILVNERFGSPKTYYLAADPNHTAQVQVFDDDGRLPTISLKTISSLSIMEGEPAEFEIKVFPENILTEGQSIPIEFSVVEEGDFIRWRIKRSLTMNSSSETLSIDTHDDDIFESPGSIRVNLIETEIYNVSRTTYTAKIEILDNDEGKVPQPRISVAHSAVTSILEILEHSGNPAPSESSTPSPTPFAIPTVSIDAINRQVNEGNPVEFTLTSSFSFTSTEFVIKLSANPVGDFFEFSEPTQISRRIHGNNSVQITFPSIDDTIAEDDGRLEVSIIPDSAYKIATNQSTTSVVISDAVDRQTRQDYITASSQAFLPDVVGNMTARTSGLISQRIQQGFSEAGNVTLNLAGENTLKGLIEMSGEMTNKGSVSWRETLGDSSFAITLLSEDDFIAPTTIWGIGDQNDLSSNSTSDLPTWSGDVFTGQFGIDALISQEFLTGLSASITENDIEVGSENTENLVFTLNSTSLYPYIGWTSPNQDAELRAIAGYGIGEFTINHANYDFEVLASKSYSIALAGSKELYSTESILNRVTKLNVTVNSWLARQYVDGKDNLLTDLQTDAHYLRISTQGTHQFEFERGSSLTPLISVGIRDDRKDQLSNFGMELTSGFDYVDPIGLTLSGTGSMLLTGETGIQKMSVKSSLGYDYGSDELGLTFAISPTWGQTRTDAQNTLWSNNILANDKEVGQNSDGTQVSSEIGYGFTLGEDSRKLNLYSGYEFDTQSDDELLLGTSVSIGTNLGFDLEGIRKFKTEGEEATKYQFNAHLSW